MAGLLQRAEELWGDFDGDRARQWNILRLLDEGNTLGPVTETKDETSGTNATFVVHDRPKPPSLRLAAGRSRC